MKCRLVVLFFYSLLCTSIFAQSNIAPKDIVGKRIVFYDIHNLLETQGSFLFKKNNKGELTRVRYSDFNTLKCFYFQKPLVVKSLFAYKGKQYIEAQSEETTFCFLIKEKYTYLDHVLVLDSIENELEAYKRQYCYKQISDRERNLLNNLTTYDNSWRKISPLYAEVTWEGYILPSKIADGVTWKVSYLGKEQNAKGDMSNIFLRWEDLNRKGVIIHNICDDIYVSCAIGVNPSDDYSSRGINIDDLLGRSTDPDTTKVYHVVDRPPMYPSGEPALQKYVDTHVKYPQIAQEQDIHGTVILHFVVNEDGSVGEVQIVKSLEPHCDAEAVRVVKSLPKFVPGKQQGRAVKVWFTLSVHFGLPLQPTGSMQSQPSGNNGSHD